MKGICDVRAGIHIPATDAVAKLGILVYTSDGPVMV